MMWYLDIGLFLDAIGMQLCSKYWTQHRNDDPHWAEVDEQLQPIDGVTNFYTDLDSNLHYSYTLAI